MLNQIVTTLTRHFDRASPALVSGGLAKHAQSLRDASVGLNRLLATQLSSDIAFATDVPLFIHNGEIREVLTKRAGCRLEVKGSSVQAKFLDLQATATQMETEIRKVLEDHRTLYHVPSAKLAPMYFALAMGPVTDPDTHETYIAFVHRFAIVS